jgi:hypothetical protein
VHVPIPCGHELQCKAVSARNGIGERVPKRGSSALVWNVQTRHTGSRERSDGRKLVHAEWMLFLLDWDTE